MRPKHEHLVLGTSSKDRGWKGKFIFIENASLGNAGDHLPDGWETSVVDLKALVTDPGAEPQTLKFLQLPTGQRTFNRHALIVVEDDEGDDNVEEVGEHDSAPAALGSTHSVKVKVTHRMSNEEIKRRASKRKNHSPGQFTTEVTPSLPRKVAKSILTVTPKMEGSLTLTFLMCFLSRGEGSSIARTRC